MPLIVAGQRTPEWHAARRGKITASLAAACLGLDDNCSQIMAWKRIMGLVPDATVTDDMQRGIDREADAVYAWECGTGLLAMPTGLWVHPNLPWLAASPDGLVGDDGVLEAKCPRTVPETISAKYRVQLAVQMCVTQREIGHFCAWVEGYEPFVDKVQWGAQDAGFIHGLTEFYKKYILTNTQPPRKGSKHE